MAMVLNLLQMETNTEAFIKMVNLMEKANITGQQELFIKECFNSE